MKKNIALILSFLAFAGGAALLNSCKKSGDHAVHDQAPAKKLYHCPMHPNYTSDRPGDCPICGMKLVLIEDSGAPAQAGEIKISPEREQLIGVKTAEAQEMELKKIVRASARVAYDADLYNAIGEYREALAAKERLQGSPLPDVRQRANALIRASALKLQRLGISPSQLEKGDDNSTNLILTERGGPVWVYAQIYEYEAGLVKPGQTMEATVSALPGKKFAGIVKSVDPILNAESRSLRARALVPNAEGLLKSEMYVDAKIIVPLGRKLAVPEEAVLDTGERKLVFVVTAPGTYQSREVETGQEAEGFYEVLSGLKSGERVVSSANFLIDSESRLKSAVSGAGHTH